MKTSLDSGRQAIFRRLWQRMLAKPSQMILIVTLALAGNILILSGPMITGLAIDQISLWAGSAGAEFFRLLLFLLLVYLGGSLCQWLLGWLTSGLAADVSQRLRSDVYHHLEKLPLQFFDRTPHGDVTGRISTDIDQMNDGLISGLPQLFSGLVTLLGSLVFMFRISAPVTALIIALTPFTFLISRTIARKSYDQYREEARLRGDLNGLAEELIDRHELVRSLNGAEQQLADYRARNQELYGCGQKAQFYSSLTNPSTRLVNAISYILVGLAGSLLAVKGRLSVGEVGSLLFYANQFSKPINEITSVMTQLQAALASAGRLFGLLDQPAEPDEDVGTPELMVTDGQVRFRHVSFAYDPQRPLIEDLTLSVPPCSKVAIVGPTGAGKTTLVNLLMRFYEWQHGRILIDGQDIRDVTRDSLRQSFGMVLQDVWLFAGTIRENLAFAKPEAGLEEIQEVCRQVEADPFIRRLEHGYDTLIGDRATLSQGQQQLLTIARVMLQNPPMLILDEATSNIDTLTELRVQRAFLRMMDGRTSFIIAHRLSTIIDADLILVMRDGTIIERGTFEQLLSSETYFKQLYESQFAGQTI